MHPPNRKYLLKFEEKSDKKNKFPLGGEIRTLVETPKPKLETI